MISLEKPVRLNFWQKHCHNLLAKISVHLIPPGTPAPSPSATAELNGLRGVVSDLEKRRVKSDAYWRCAYWHLREAAEEMGVLND